MLRSIEDDQAPDPSYESSTAVFACVQPAHHGRAADLMSKSVKAVVRLLVPAGQAKPAPPVGPALGQAGLNIMAFCKDFNAKTADIKVAHLPSFLVTHSPAMPS